MGAQVVAWELQLGDPGGRCRRPVPGQRNRLNENPKDMPIGKGMRGGARMRGQIPSSCGPCVCPKGRNRPNVGQWWERVRYAGTRRAMCPPPRATARFASIATVAGWNANPTIAHLITRSGDLGPTHAWERGVLTPWRPRSRDHRTFVESPSQLFRRMVAPWSPYCARRSVRPTRPVSTHEE